ncbi:MAG: hypothetical protein ACTHQ3_15690 [Motilibacteraceae bacterium]
MSIGTVVGFSGSPGSSQTATATATLPTIATAGYAVAVIGTNVATTTTITSAPAGWTLLDGPYDNGSNNMRVWLYGKAVTSADSGAAFSATMSATGRWAVAGAYLPGASAIDVSLQWIDNTDDLSIDVPAITPGVADAYRLVVVFDRSASGALTVTPPAGWDELADVCSTNTSGARFGGWAGGVQLAGQTGVAQGTASATYSVSARNSGWELTVAPAATSTTYQATGTVSASSSVAGAVTAVLLMAGTVAGVSGVSGAATRVPQVLQASGTVAATSSAAGAVTSLLPTSGTVVATSGVSGAVTVVSGSTVQQVAGTVNAVSGVTGAVTARLVAAGTATATSTTTGAVTAILQAAGTASATSGVSGDPTALLQVGGTVEAVSDTAGDVDLIHAPVVLQVAGVVEAVSTVTGDVRLIGQGDGRAVRDPRLTLTTARSTLTLDQPTGTLTLTMPASTLELT